MYRLLLFCLCLAPALALYEKGEVQELTPSNFDRLVVHSEEVWIVEFYAPWCGHCRNLVPEYTKLANAAKGVIKVGAVNADDHKALGKEFGVQGFPTILIFSTDRTNPTKYNGARDAQAMSNEALNHARELINIRLHGRKTRDSKSDGQGVVIELDDSNFDRLVLESDDLWLVEFYAPWCGHCKELEPHWKRAAKELSGKVKLGAYNADKFKDKASKYEIRGFPTIKYFGRGKKSNSEEYIGGRTSLEIIKWGLERHSETVPPPDVFELISEETAQTVCHDASLCIVSILPHILDCDAKCRNDYLITLRELADKYKKHNWGWVWTVGGSQPHIEEALELGGSGYPRMAAVSHKKLKYTPLRLSFSKEGINEFLRDISFGRGSTAPVRGAAVPKVLHVPAWDGKDGELPVEEEYDLSDVDLDDLDEIKEEL